MLLANRYQTVRALGEGGFGQTFLAEDTQMPSRRICVIKQLKPVTTEAGAYQVIQDRFQREAAILEKLGENHPQIPRLYAYFNEAGQFYLVQEWIEGETLEQLVNRKALFTENSVRKILLDLLPVLEFIHAQGMIHRDIKPENIILRNSNQEPVLIDYGAVRETMGTVFNSRGNPTSSIVIGTPGYMPSEQAAGRPIPSSDLYSLGLTAIYLLTGRSPQLLETDPQTGEILWQQNTPQLSPELAAILTKMVHSHPRDRYASATQLRAVLESPTSTVPSPQIYQASTEVGTVMLASNPSSVVSTSSPQRDRSKLITAGIVGGGLLAAAGTVSFFLNRDHYVPTPPPMVRSTIASPNPTEKPFTEASPSPVERLGVRAASPEPSPVASSSPKPSPTDNNPPGKAISVPLVLKGIAGGQVKVYAQPSTRSNSPHYGLTGDQVIATRLTDNDTQESWYYVKFPSGAEGWIQAEQTDSVKDPAETSQFPREGRLLGETIGSRVNIRSAPSTTASAPSYGLVGDRVVVLEQTLGKDDRTWYFVEFPASKTRGWVREDFMGM
jgi:serine/threonine-protein kinase